MNLGTKVRRAEAIEHARANARFSGEPRYLHLSSTWHEEKQPLRGPNIFGVYTECLMVLPDGTCTPYTPERDRKDEHLPG